MKTSVQREWRGDVPALVLAAHARREEEVRGLLDSGADVDAADGDGITPLMAAAMCGSLPLTRLLLSAGADCHLRNKWGMTAQAIAQWHGHEALSALLDDREMRHCLTSQSSARGSVK